MKMIRFPDGAKVPALGQGTWMMAERAKRRAQEIAALQEGIDLGLTLIDTAEMYADGASEELVGEAIRQRRDQVFLVSKAYPQNASAQTLPLACEASLRRLGTDRLDLYLLHWRGRVPLAETVDAMEHLVKAGKILRWGVSNLDTDDMEELAAAGGTQCQTDQILYNLTRRGSEHDLIPWLREQNQPVMAYSPIEQGRLLAHRELARLAASRDATPAQIALAWLLAQDNVIAIPKASTSEHVRENHAAAELILSDDDLRLLDDLFPRPWGPVALEIL
ncbi:aldo/keto reductase [Sphingomonas sp. AP4-R1]|uniref:aldo/keto reductase n=1 Tax=Sphingomonas sp. AP4-R1 TaxID=2735134 RepID=UPI001493B935|nr:aldo/keto reductase [Sphingomonas sp. AP4-R1]QJU59258.1 aldo/keto reductase [Sphingomonas sp. AP4-R1]